MCWVDADIRNFGHHFITGLIGPLLTDASIEFVKGYYRRPLHGEPTGGGRVTELVARPVLSVLFPHLAGFIQPLGGEYSGRRSLLEAGALRRRLGRGDRAVGRHRRTGRNRRDRAGRPRRAGTSESRARRPRTPGDRDPGDGAPARGPVPHRPRDSGTRFTEAFEPVTVDVEVRERPPIATIAAYQDSVRSLTTAGVSSRDLECGLFDEYRRPREGFARLPHSVGQGEHGRCAQLPRQWCGRRRTPGPR